MKADIPNDLMPGDIVLVHGRGMVARGIRLITQSHWAHALIIEEAGGDDYAILEAVPRGLAFGMLGIHYKGEDIAVFRLRQWRPRGDIVAQALQGLSEQEQVQRTIIAKAREMGRYHYDHLVLWRTARELGWRRCLTVLMGMALGDDLPEVPHRRDRYVVCSELIQEAYAAAGVPLIDDRYLLLPRTIAALASTKLERIYGAGKR